MRRIRAAIPAMIMCFVLLLGGCTPSTDAKAEESNQQNGVLTVSFDYQKQSGYASNQFAVWVENADGTFIKTLYATKFTADGGYKKRPDALANWVECSGLADRMDADTVSGATPKSGALRYNWDLTGADGARVPDGTYRFCVEGTLRWKNNVLYTGEIEIGAEAVSAEAEAEYLFEPSADQAALTDASDEIRMIGPVSAQYTPPELPASNK